MKLTWKHAAALVAAAAIATTALAQQRLFFGIATGGTGGTYYPLGGMLAQLISNKAVVDGKKISATAEAAGASVANVKLLGNKDIESAFVAADILDAAYNGKGQFNGAPIKNVRALGALYPETVQLITRGGFGHQQRQGSEGQERFLGFTGLGPVPAADRPAAGLRHEAQPTSRKTCRRSPRRSTRSRTATCDATLITAGVPTAAVTDFAQSHALKVIPLSGPEIAALQKQQPYYTSVKLPANSYKGQTAAVDTLAVMAVWATHESVPDNVAYEVTKALFENVAIMGQVHVQGKNISPSHRAGRGHCADPPRAR